MIFLDCKPCLVNLDAWMRPSVKADSAEQYEYALLYADDALVVSENAEKVLRNEIGKYFEVKPNSVGPPSQHIRGSIKQSLLENGVHAWAFSLS